MHEEPHTSGVTIGTRLGANPATAAGQGTAWKLHCRDGASQATVMGPATVLKWLGQTVSSRSVIPSKAGEGPLWSLPNSAGWNSSLRPKTASGNCRFPLIFCLVRATDRRRRAVLGRGPLLF